MPAVPRIASFGRSVLVCASRWRYDGPRVHQPSWRGPPLGACRERPARLGARARTHAERHAQLAQGALGAVEAKAGLDDRALACVERLQERSHAIAARSGNALIVVLGDRIGQAVAKRVAGILGAAQDLLQRARAAVA